MGLLSWLFGSKAPPAGGLEHAGGGGYDFEVKGESHYQDNLSAICGGHCEEGHEHECVATLVPEPTNKFDHNAVAVHINGRKVAHLSRDDAPEYHAALKRLRVGSAPVKCDAVIVGGWDRGKRGRGNFGVKLDLVLPLELS